MTKQLIGIAANEVADSGAKIHHLPIVYTPAGYVKGIQRAGGFPIVIPIGTPEDAKFYVNQIDKLVLAGGQNIHPRYYGETIQTDYDISYPPRDEFELALVREALKQGKPIFAVCRGMQVLNVALGGSSNQKLSNITEIAHVQDLPRDQASHTITTKAGSILATLYGATTQVNSFHRQGVNRLGDGLTATAWSADGLVEGLEGTAQRLLAVQWHPDFAYETLPQEQRVFDYVVKSL